MAGYDYDFGFNCEECGQTLGGGLYDFEESKELIRQHGWISRYVQGEWLNFCSKECLCKYREKQK